MGVYGDFGDLMWDVNGFHGIFMVFFEFDGFYGILSVFDLVLVVMRVLMESTVK